MSDEYWKQIESHIHVGKMRVRIMWNGQWIEGIVLSHSNIDEFDHEDKDWPEDAEVADIMWVQLIHDPNMEVWWFETEEAHFLIDDHWVTFNDLFAMTPTGDAS